MRIKNLLAIVTVMTLGGNAIHAAQWEDHFRYDKEAVDKFPINEFSVDLFGTYANENRFGDKRKWEDGHGGGGVGLNYFLNRYVGIGADSYVEEWKAPYRVNGSVFLRYPIPGGFGFAPYGFGGGGRELKYVPQWTFHGGAGLEFRFNRYTGIFVDGRRVFPDKTEDYTLARAGMRLNF